MIILVAGRHDPAAQRLASRWEAHGATLLTASDLSAPGWRQFVAAAGEERAAVGGTIVARDEIAGVLIRRPGVHEVELTHIVAADRAYVAAEMTAFLTFWTSRLPCPVLNRPSAASLLGPAWRPEQWVQAASRLGMRVNPVRRRIELPADRTAAMAEASPERGERCSHAVTVVADRCFGQVDETLARQARRLAAAAEVGLLEVHFSSPEAGAAVVGANLQPDLAEDGAADAVLAYLLERRR